MSDDYAIETGWLIEHHKGGDIFYLTIENEGVAWTRDSLKALRFAREQDAQMFAYGEDCDKVAEHMWG